MMRTSFFNDHERRFSRCDRGERGHEWQRSWRGRGARGARGERPLDHGDLRMVVLALIGDRPRHGYELIKEIEERTGGAYAPSPGAIYPTLAMLEDQQWIVAQPQENGRKSYAISDQGRLAIDANRPAIERSLTRLDGATASADPNGEESRNRHRGWGRGRARRGGQDLPPVVGIALSDLEQVLGQRLARGDASDAALAEIAEALGAASDRIDKA